MAEAPLLPFALAWTIGLVLAARLLPSSFIPAGVGQPSALPTNPELPVTLLSLGAGVVVLLVVSAIASPPGFMARGQPTTAASMVSGRVTQGEVGGRARVWGAAAALLLATVLAGSLRYLSWRAISAGDLPLLMGSRSYCWWGTVVSEPVRRDGRLELTLALEAVAVPRPGGTGDRQRIRGKVLLRVLQWEGSEAGQSEADQPDEDPRVGQCLRIYGWVSPPSPPRNPGEFDYAGWLRAQGIGALLYTRDRSAVEVSGWGRLSPLQRAGSWMGSRFLSAVRAHLPPEQAAVVEGMVLGVRSGIPGELEEAFRRSGLVHLLAVSGSNVALVAGAVETVLGPAGIRAARVGALLAVWVFAAAASGGASVGRAALTATVMLLGRILGRRTEPVNNLSLAVLALTAMNPCSWEDPGFWLSVGATTGILGLATAGSPWGRLPARLRGVGQMLAVTVAAQIAVLPVSLLYFQQVSVIAPLSNLVVLPLVGAVTVGGLGCALAANLHPFLGTLAFWPLEMLVRVMTSVVRFWGALPGATLGLPVPRWVHLLGYYVVLAWAWGWIRWRLLPVRGPWTRARLLIAFLSVVVWIGLMTATAPPRHVLHAVFFSVGQGDAALFYLPGGPAVLVDCGPADDRYDAGKDTILPFLRRQGIRRLDLLVLTHGHADHVGGAAAVLAGVPVEEIWFGPDIPSTAFAASGTALPVPGKVVQARAGTSRVMAPGWQITVLHPPVGEHGGELPGGEGMENDLSLVTLLSYGEVDFLLAADIERVGEAMLLQAWQAAGKAMPETLEVLKVPHHGAAASSGPALLALTRPREAVIQVGPNVFGHPHDATLERLARSGARVWRTDHQGAVLFCTDGKGLRSYACLNNRSLFSLGTVLRSDP